MNSYQKRKLQLWRAERFAQQHPLGVHIAIALATVVGVGGAFYLGVLLDGAL